VRHRDHPAEPRPDGLGRRPAVDRRRAVPGDRHPARRRQRGAGAAGQLRDLGAVGRRPLPDARPHPRRPRDARRGPEPHRRRARRPRGEPRLPRSVRPLGPARWHRRRDDRRDPVPHPDRRPGLHAQGVRDRRPGRPRQHQRHRHGGDRRGPGRGARRYPRPQRRRPQERRVLRPHPRHPRLPLLEEDVRRRGLWLDLLAAAVFVGLLAALPGILRGAYGQASVSYLALGIRAVGLAVLALSWDLVARVLALGLGAATLRLYGIYFAIATLAFAEVLKTVVKSLPFAISGGSVGTNLPPLFRPVFVAGEMERWEVAYLRNQGYFHVYLGLLAVAIVVSLLIQRSRLRQAFTAVRTNEFVAGVMGVNPARAKLVAFVISSVIVGMLGAIEAHRFGSVNPDATF